MRRTNLICLTLALLIVPGVALADSIDPASYTDSIAVGGSVTITKTIEISSADASSLDVYFVFDATGSMGSLLTAAASAASSVMTALSTSYSDLQVGVGTYQDFNFSPWGGATNSPFTQLLDIGQVLGGDANNIASATSTLGGFTSLDAFGGGDDAESAFYALDQIANNASWRTGASHVIVWFGDQPSHDGDIETLYPSGIGLADVIASLSARNIIVEAISMGSTGGLDRTLSFNTGLFQPDGITPIFVTVSGQGSAVAAGTGGNLTHYSNPADLDSTEIKNAIVAAVNSGFFDYTQIGLEVDLGVPGLVVTYVALDADGGLTHDGTFDRSETRSFGFEVTYEGVLAGTYRFPIYGLLDGGRILTESDLIYVGRDVPEVPEPSTIALMGLGLLGLGITARRKMRK